jgi:hypothetical protein
MASGRGNVGTRNYDPSGMAALAARNSNDEPVLAYSTEAGQAWLGDAMETLDLHVEDESVDLILTSPPFALQRPKEYGNESQESYKDWFLPQKGSRFGSCWRTGVEGLGRDIRCAFEASRGHELRSQEEQRMQDHVNRLVGLRASR